MHSRHTTEREREGGGEPIHLRRLFCDPYKDKKIRWKIVRENKCIRVERRCVLITLRGIFFVW